MQNSQKLKAAKSLSTYRYECKNVKAAKHFSSFTHTPLTSRRPQGCQPRSSENMEVAKEFFNILAQANMPAAASLSIHSVKSESLKELFRIRAQANNKAARIFALYTLTQK